MADIYIGRQIGNYRIEQIIASGSSGTVYLARHLHLKERTVAIKILHFVHLGSDEEKNHFLQEAQILEKLRDLPNILPLLDVGIDGNVPYMITEYAQRGSLHMHMQQYNAPLPLQEALTIIEHVGWGLQGAHDKGIVHRDLKPENILFNAKGEALLADFGLSTVLSTASVKHTYIAGTPAYMAPEQFRGEICKESDQYALACITYELLTNCKLFDTPDFLSMGFCHAYESPTPPCQLNPQIPVSIEDALLRALAKERTERYPSILAFVTALDNQVPTIAPRDVYDDEANLPLGTAPGQPTLPPEPSTIPPPQPKGPKQTSNRNIRAVIVAALVILALLVIGSLTVSANPSTIASFSHILSGNTVPPATITIRPASKTVKDTFVMQSVDGPSNLDNRQISVRQLTSTRTATDTVNATGHTHTSAKVAIGTLTFHNGSTAQQTIPPTPITNANGIQVIADQIVTIPGANPNSGTLGVATVPAHAVSPGTNGDIAAGSIAGSCCLRGNFITVTNVNAFTGGQDAQDYHFLQGSQVNDVTNAHQATLKSDAQNDIKNQMKSGEKSLGNINCQDPTTKSDQPIGTTGVNVTTAHVTVSVSCSTEVYDANAVQTIVQKALQQDESFDPGAGYVLAGHIVTQTQSQKEPDGTLTFSVTAKSIWYYQWTASNKQALLNKIKGMSKVQAQAMLNSSKGVGQATIDISNGGSTLPTDVSQIKLDVQTVNGL